MKRLFNLKTILIMANPLPTDIFTGYELVAASGTVTAQSIAIPLTTLSTLTAGEANASTGDGREVVRAILVRVLAWYQAVTTKPVNMTIAVGNPTSTSGVQTVAYTTSFKTTNDFTVQSLVAEP